MGSLLSPSQECHPFTPSPLAHDLVVSPTKGKTKTELEREVAALRAKLNEAQKKLEELKKAGDAASGELKKGIENAWAELRKAFDSATAKFKSGS
jgi:Skp family chaperone for outer membrane proteins